MKNFAIALLVAALAAAHGDHSFDLQDENDSGMSYAERHMHTEHHIDSFDLPSFFKLHDLDMNGFWDVAEIEAVYGVHHHTVKEALGGQQANLDGRARVIVDKVLRNLDTDKDGKVSLAEFEAGGKDGLPSFAGYSNLGHHYDEESEYFLHHEELYHSTPDTQTDESYTHPEDIAHFKHHKHIESEEDARERRFQGLAEDADLTKDHAAVDPLAAHAHAAGEGPSEEQGNGDDQQKVYKAGEEVPEGNGPPSRQRIAPGAQPQRIKEDEPDVKGQLDEAKKRVASGSHPYDGHKPRNNEERLRAGVPYKYKMRKGFRADEF